MHSKEDSGLRSYFRAINSGHGFKTSCHLSGVSYNTGITARIYSNKVAREKLRNVKYDFFYMSQAKNKREQVSAYLGTLGM